MVLWNSACRRWARAKCEQVCRAFPRYHRQKRVAYRLNPMGMVLEEWDEVMAVVKKCYLRIRKDCNRVSCSIKIDYRKGRRDGWTVRYRVCKRS